MTQFTLLDDIALGDASPAEARAALSEALKQPTPKTLQRIYTALRAWTWKALDGHRRDSDLREWFDILKRTGAYLAEGHQAYAQRLQVLHELVYESISVAEARPVDKVLSRQHVKNVLALLYAAPQGRLNRMQIGKQLGLRQANLTRILNLVSSAGLIERSSWGKHAIFQLTRPGSDAAAALPPQPHPAAPSWGDVVGVDKLIKHVQIRIPRDLGKAASIGHRFAGISDANAAVGKPLFIQVLATGISAVTVEGFSFKSVASYKTDAAEQFEPSMRMETAPSETRMEAIYVK